MMGTDDYVFTSLPEMPESNSPEIFEEKEKVVCQIPFIVYEAAEIRHIEEKEKIQKAHAEDKKQLNKNWKIIYFSTIAVLVALFAGVLLFFYQYDWSTYTISTDGGGDASYSEQGDNGNIYYGESSGTETNTQETGN